MNYLCAFTMLLSAFATAFMVCLGIDYMTVGHGLHPALATVGAVPALFIGLFAASLIND